MLLIIIAFIFIVAVGFVIISDRQDWWVANGAAITATIVVGFGLLLSSATAIINHANPAGSLARHEARYDALVYQLENDIYDNDNDLGKKELYDQIMEWNEDVASGQIGSHSFWFGVFYQPIWDDLQKIDFPDP